MGGRIAGEDEVAAWQDDGWVLLEGLVDTAEIDSAAADLSEIFPSPEEYHADPEAAIDHWVGRPPKRQVDFPWPPDGPGFRADQGRFRGEFPFPGRGGLNRLAVHPSVVDFAERALGTRDLLLYQLAVSAKYTGDTNYEQPMHTDRNHSWVPARGRAPWQHLQTFLYLSDVGPGNAPTHLVPLSAAEGRSTSVWGVMPAQDPELYAAELPAPGSRGSLLAYRNDVFHRGVDLTDPGGARFILGIGFKRADQPWIGFHAWQLRATDPAWVRFVHHASPRDLELFGFPPPGHPIWDEELLDETAALYPKLDLSPWRAAAPAAQ